MVQPIYKRLLDWFEGKSDYITKDEVVAFIAAEKKNPDHARELAAFADVLVYNALMQKAVCHRSSQRANSRRVVERQTTRQRLVVAAGNIAEGKSSGLFDQQFKVNDKGQIRRVAEMDGPAHKYVANSYGHLSRRNGMFAEFHQAVAKKCGLRRTDEVYTAEQYEAMYRNFLPDAA